MKTFGLEIKKQNNTYRKVSRERDDELVSVLDMHFEPSEFRVIEDNFVKCVAADADPPTLTGGWVAEQTNSTGGLTLGTYGLIMDSEASAQHDALILYGTNAMIKLVAGKTLYFEATVEFVQGAAGTIGKVETVIGLAEDGSGVIASGSLANKEFIGFAIETAGDANLKFITNDGGTESIDDTGIDIEFDKEYKLAFIVNPGVFVGAYVNDVAIALSNVTTALVPITDALRPTFVVGADAASNDPLMYVKYYKIAEEL